MGGLSFLFHGNSEVFFSYQFPGTDLLLVPFIGDDHGHDLVGPGPDGGKAEIPDDTFYGIDIKDGQTFVFSLFVIRSKLRQPLKTPRG